MNKIYLGDAVYADWDGMLLTLTVEYGEGPAETVHLEGNVIINLLKYLEEQKIITWELKK